MSATPLASLSYTLEHEWLRVPPLIVGTVPTGRGTPQCYVCVERGEERLRFDVHANRDDHCFREEVTVVQDTLFLGIGHRLLVVDLATRDVLTQELDCHFGSLHALPDGVLVTTGCSLYRFALDGSQHWASMGIAFDGLVIHEVRDGQIVGEAEQHPQGAWEPFCVSLESGLPLPRPPPTTPVGHSGTA